MWKQVSTILKERKKLQNLISYQKSTGKNLGGDLNGTHILMELTPLCLAAELGQRTSGLHIHFLL